MTAPTPPAKRLAYRALRRLGTSQTEAARMVGVARRTGQRLDHAEPGRRCPLCAHILDGNDKEQ